eukprot:TRINITY_DN8717_c0_g1_i1.p1 TRINITY_DN8717_c0_g1~~TRINITY_DN8717_c0_g1_i1.p1  ORF type:complete len:753 (+),score=183.23 TRINITY_DN8717_c0_g1_i1:26-2260(+)
MEQSLLQWIDSLQGESISSLQELADVRKFSQIYQIFSDTGFACDIPQNPTWIQQKSAWGQFLGLLATFYVSTLGASTTVAGLQEEFAAYIDLDALCRTSDSAAIFRATSLLVAAAVKSSKRDQIIYKIMQFNTNVQTNLMNAIQQAMEVLNRACSSSEQHVSPSQAPAAPQDECSAAPSTENLQNEIANLKRRYLSALDEKEKLCDAVKDLDCRLLAAEKAKRTLEALLEEETRKSAAIRAREVSSSPAAFESKSSRHLAQENDSLKALGVQRDKQIAELRKQLEAGSQNIFKIKELQDEIEILRDKSFRMDQMQEKMKLQERRLNELSELRIKYQEAEQHLQALQKQKVEFDDLTSRQIPQLRTKLETYRTQVVELSAKTSDLEAQLALKEKQLKEVQSKLDDSVRVQKQQDLLLKDLSKAQPISSDFNALSSSGTNVPQPKKSSLANLLQTVDPEAEKKAKAIQDSLLANLNDAKSRLDVLEDDVATKQLLIERLQQELGSTKVRLAELQNEYQEVRAERDGLLVDKTNLQRQVGSLEYKLSQSETEKNSWKDKATSATHQLEAATARIKDLEHKNRLQEMQNKLIVSAYYNTQMQLLQQKLAPKMEIESSQTAAPSQDAMDQDFQSASDFSRMLDGSQWNAGNADATEDLSKSSAGRRFTQAPKVAANRKRSVAQIRQRALQPVDGNSLQNKQASTAAAPSKRLTLAERALSPRPPISSTGANSGKSNPYESAPKRQKIRE